MKFRVIEHQRETFVIRVLRDFIVVCAAKRMLGPAYANVRLRVCAVKRRRFPVGASPTRRPLQPEATGAGMEVTKCLKPSDSGSRNTVTARVCRPQRE